MNGESSIYHSNYSCYCSSMVILQSLILTYFLPLYFFTRKRCCCLAQVQLSQILSWLKLAFVLCHEVPILVQKVEHMYLLLMIASIRKTTMILCFELCNIAVLIASRNNTFYFVEFVNILRHASKSGTYLIILFYRRSLSVFENSSFFFTMKVP